jgi:glycosyltransferase involved in cell wall biosynthesis
MPDRSVLLFSPHVDGHRQTYVAVLADWFRAQGWGLVAALGDTHAGAPPRETAILSLLVERTGARIVPLGNAAGFHEKVGGWVPWLRRIEDDVYPEWTVIVTGDECRTSLKGLGHAGHPGGARRAAIFIYVNHEYAIDLRALALPQRLRVFNWWWRMRWRERRYFRERVWRELGLDRILTTNEDFWTSAGDERIRLMPEVHRAFGFDLPGSDPRIALHREAYRVFLDRHQGRDVILYYGTRVARRGYDTLLALANDCVDTVFVSCGRDARGEPFAFDVAAVRGQLRSADRLFEMDLPFLPEHRLTDDLFQSARYVLLPYRDWYGLSGTLFQAAWYGKPVLVPDIGHMATMVRRHGIGLTFAHNNTADLRRRFHDLRRQADQFVPAARAFGRRNDLAHLHQAFADTFAS